MTGKIKTLFLCTGNSCRSQMAEAFLRKYGGEHFEAYSAGLEPQGIHPYTERVMNEIGVSLEGQRSKDVTEYLGRVHFGYLITVCAHAEEKCPTAWPDVSRRFHWFFQDPAAVEGTEEEKLSAFRQVRDQIEQRIKTWLVGQGLA